MSKPISEMTEPELGRLMTRLARAIESHLPPKTPFTLLVYEDSGIAQYISNGPRAEIIKAMRSCADRLEAREDVTR